MVVSDRPPIRFARVHLGDGGGGWGSELGVGVGAGAGGRGWGGGRGGVGLMYEIWRAIGGVWGVWGCGVGWVVGVGVWVCGVGCETVCVCAHPNALRAT